MVPGCEEAHGRRPVGLGAWDASDGYSAAFFLAFPATAPVNSESKTRTFFQFSLFSSMNFRSTIATTS